MKNTLTEFIALLLPRKSKADIRISFEYNCLYIYVSRNENYKLFCTRIDVIYWLYCEKLIELTTYNNMLCGKASPDNEYMMLYAHAMKSKWIKST